MITINKNHLYRFKCFSNTYNYMVAPGLWLSFNINSLEYIGYNLFYYVYDVRDIENKCNQKLDKLIALDILEVRS